MPTSTRVLEPTPSGVVSRLPASPRLRRAFWLLVATQAVFVGASNFPTPLFPIWADRYGFGALTVTLLFAVYVAALVPSILTLGRASDRFGRRPTVAAGMALTVVSSLVFAGTQGVAWLVAGEILYGIAGGLVMSATPVAIRELHPKGDVAAAGAGRHGRPGRRARPGSRCSAACWRSVGPHSTVTPFLVHAALVRPAHPRPPPHPRDRARA